jgi:hypothetical protein
MAHVEPLGRITVDAFALAEVGGDELAFLVVAGDLVRALLVGVERCKIGWVAVVRGGEGVERKRIGQAVVAGQRGVGEPISVERLVDLVDRLLQRDMLQERRGVEHRGRLVEQHRHDGRDAAAQRMAGEGDRRRGNAARLQARDDLGHRLLVELRRGLELRTRADVRAHVLQPVDGIDRACIGDDDLVASRDDHALETVKRVFESVLFAEAVQRAGVGEVLGGALGEVRKGRQSGELELSDVAHGGLPGEPISARARLPAPRAGSGRAGTRARCACPGGFRQ